MKKLVFVILIALALATDALAQEAPVPRNAPRVAVNRASLARNDATVPPSRDIQGAALIIDGEKLRVGDSDLRLFGIVPPQLSASFGPQARSTLDEVAAGQPVSCHIRDRDHDGRLLATCHSSGGSDLAYELLRRGLAVSARGSLADTELAQPYIAAEQAAQSQRLGLWSVATPAPVPASAIPVVIPAATSAAPAAPASTASSVVVTNAAAAEAVNKPANAAPAQPVAANPKTETPKTESKPVAVAAVSVPVATHVIPREVSDDQAVAAGDGTSVAAAGFFASYQILIGGFLMMMTALGVLLTLGFQQRRDKQEEMRALAAALRGELMAARAVCLTRLKAIANDSDDKDIAWPRLRSTLYQAYVSQIGWLGAQLARQIASIYGQATDYAAFYSSADEAQIAQSPKRQALQNLIGYIEAVLPRLASIEETGQRPSPGVSGTSQRAVQSPTQPMPPATRQNASSGAVVDPPSQDEPSITFSKSTLSIPFGAGKAGESAGATTVTETVVTQTTTIGASADQDRPVGALWDTLRRFAQAHLAGETADHPHDEVMSDYTTLIEQDIANLESSDEMDDLHFGTTNAGRKSSAG